MPMRCDDVQPLLAGLVDGEVDHPGAQAHIDGCLRCQADLARYRRLLRGLGQLRAVALEPIPGAMAQTLAALEAAERRVARSLFTARRIAVAGAGTAVAAGATAAVLLARSRRRGPAALGLAG